MRGYDPDAVENIQEHEWYSDLSSSTSLRNNLRVRQSVRRVMENVKRILNFEDNVPDLDHDEDRLLLEELLNDQSRQMDSEFKDSNAQSSSQSPSSREYYAVS